MDRIVFRASAALRCGATPGRRTRRVVVRVDGHRCWVASCVPSLELPGAVTFARGSPVRASAWRVADDAFVELPDAALARAVAAWLDEHAVPWRREGASAPVPLALGHDVYPVELDADSNH